MKLKRGQREKPFERERALYRQSLDLWSRCGLAGWFVMLSNGAVVDFYEAQHEANRCAPNALHGARYIVLRIPGTQSSKSPFTRPPAGSTPIALQ